MPFDEQLATRVRRYLANTRATTERKMFGGLCFMQRGNMVCGILGKDLIVRVPVDDYANLLSLPNTRVFDMTGRPLRGFIQVRAAGLKNTNSLNKWLRIASSFAASLPAK